MTDLSIRGARGIPREGRYYVYRNKAGEERYTQVVTRDLNMADIKALNVQYAIRVRPSKAIREAREKAQKSWYRGEPTSWADLNVWS